MKRNKIKQIRRRRRKAGIHKRLLGTPERPRLAVYRSLRHIYAQVIDDLSGQTLFAASSMSAKLPAEGDSGENSGDDSESSGGGGNKAGAVQVGKDLARLAKSKGIQKIAFDRSGFRYHGRIKALADAARKGGLAF